jgi:hypothetical protein
MFDISLDPSQRPKAFGTRIAGQASGDRTSLMSAAVSTLCAWTLTVPAGIGFRPAIAERAGIERPVGVGSDYDSFHECTQKRRGNRALGSHPRSSNFYWTVREKVACCVIEPAAAVT